MEGIQEIARSYFERASADEKSSIVELFSKLDVNGDGKISLREFKKSVSSWLSAEAVFKKLYTNGDGTLDFEEFLCLHYMEKKVTIPRCGGCWDLLVGPYFSCLLCLGRGANNTYDLCCSCFRHSDNLSHHHSSDYMRDHHSLLTLFRDRTAAAAAQNSQSQSQQKEMEELREIARAHYRAGSPQVQELAYEFYRSMDSDGDGRVDLAEFLAFMRQEGYSYMHNPYFFNELDLDGNGTLDFSEVMTLYYIIKSGRPFCNACGNFIPGIFFSCVECFSNHGGASFDLCRDCYRNANCSHNHDGRTQFLDNYTLLQAKRDPTSSGLTLNELQAMNLPRNAIVPVQHDRNMYIQNYNTYVVNPPNEIVPAASSTNWNKWRAALHAFELALSVGNVSATLCTIL